MAQALLLLLTAALVVSAAPRSLAGTWKIDVQKTTWENDAPPPDMVWVIKEDGPKLSVVATYTRGDGAEGRESYVFDTTGKETVNPSGDVDLRSIMKPEGDGYREETRAELANGTMTRTSFTTVSEDGKTLTQTVEMKFPDRVVKRTVVMNKQ